jgi:predicted DNA-binding transcriptional regulator AlpA
MDVVHLNQKQLAVRWSISEASLERWRSEGIGPRYLKIGGRVLYRQVDIDAYEESCLQISTSQAVVAHAPSN